MRSKKLNVEIYREAVEILRIGNRAVRIAQESNRERNIPNVYNLNGTLYYELAPQRPDLVLKDLIHILHPGLLPNYVPYFFKPLL